MNSYARALMEIAVENNTVDEIAYQFDELNDSVFTQKKWLKMMDSPMVSKEDKDKYIETLGLNKHLSHLLKLLAENKLMHLYDEIYPEWVRMIREKNKIAHINVYSVKDLNQKQIDALTKRLQPRFKKQTIEIHVKVRENLIGGLRMVYQGQSLDNSIAHELEELFTTL